MARFPPLFESAGRLTVLTARLPAAGQFRTYAALGSVTVGRGQRLVITGEGPPAGQVAKLATHRDLRSQPALLLYFRGEFLTAIARAV